MNATRIILVVLAVVAGFCLGRLTAAPGEQSDLATVASFREALDEPDWLTRTHRISTFLEDLNPDNLDEALEAFEARARYSAEGEFRLFMLAWSRFDAEAAFERALFWPEHSKTRAREAAIYAWGFLDPAGARLALRRVEEDPRLKESLSEHLVQGWAQRDDKQPLIEYLASMGRGIARQKFTNILAAKIMEHEGPEGVRTWAEAIPDDAADHYKRTVFEKAANVLAAVDPPRAAEWIEGHLEHDYAAGAPHLIIRRWVGAGEPVAALEWAQGLPKGGARDDPVRAAFDRWMQTDLDGARAWLLNVAPAPGLDQAVRAMVRQTIRGEPKTAIEWAQRIHDPDLRRRVLIGVGNRWWRKDPDAANAWMAESGLDEETREAMVKPASAGLSPNLVDRGPVPGRRRPPPMRRGRRAQRQDSAQEDGAAVENEVDPPDAAP
jgi:hypothetical protein